MPSQSSGQHPLQVGLCPMHTGLAHVHVIPRSPAHPNVLQGAVRELIESIGQCHPGLPLGEHGEGDGVSAGDVHAHVTP